jgi:hypothetical protein
MDQLEAMLAAEPGDAFLRYALAMEHASAGDEATCADQLLALIAPRPLLIGHAERDAWAGPQGAYVALAGARPAFDLLEAPPPRFALRGGTHGITDADWQVTFDFLDARLR